MGSLYTRQAEIGSSLENFQDDEISVCVDGERVPLQLQLHHPPPPHPTLPWRALQGPPRVVIDFADHDCSGGAATYPRPGSYCQQFYICSAGRSFLYTCNPGLMFDVNLGSCNWGVLVDARCNDKDDSMLAV